MADLFTPQKYIGSGKVKMRKFGTAAPLLDVGDVDQVATDPSVNEVTVPNRRGGGGNAFSKKILQSLGVTIQFRDLVPAAIARCMGGEVSQAAAATPSAEAHVGYHQGFIVLGILDGVTPVLVQDATDTTTYVAGTDYDLSDTGITVLAGGGIGDGDTLHISYGTVATDTVELFVNSGDEWELVIDGLNDAETGEPYLIELYKWSAPASGFEFLGEDAATLEAAGEALPDNSKGSGVSKFGRFRAKTPA